MKYKSLNISPTCKKNTQKKKKKKKKKKNISFTINCPKHMYAELN